MGGVGCGPVGRFGSGVLMKGKIVTCKPSLRWSNWPASLRLHSGVAQKIKTHTGLAEARTRFPREL